MKANDEHKKYLKKLKLSTIKVIIFQISILLLFLITWQLLSDYKIINTFLCSSPKKVIETIISLYKSNDLMIHIWITLKEIIISFGIGSIIGILVPYTFLGKAIGLVPVTLNYLNVIIGISALYCVVAIFAKKIYIKKYGSWI